MAADMNWLPAGDALGLDGLQVRADGCQHPQRRSRKRRGFSSEPSACEPNPTLCPLLQNYFGQTQPNDPMLQGLQGQVPFRNAGGMPAGFAAPPATANLFSSIVLPGMQLEGGADDSGDSSGGGTGVGGKKSAEQRAAAVQEKNRRAQKRFRERQVRWAGLVGTAGCLWLCGNVAEQSASASPAPAA